MAILSVEHLSFTYPQQANPVLRDVSFSIPEGSFVTLCGGTGSGKTTLLRMLKRALTPNGTQTGIVRYHGTPLAECSDRTAAAGIGFVMQRPEQQLVTDKVWHELAFGLENLGVPSAEIGRRIAEIASYLGIADCFEQDVATLSGGQKQLLNLASILVMQPDVLLLDEPTAQLDPIAATMFLRSLHRLQQELSLTVLLVEHRLEEVLPLSDRLLVLHHGVLQANDTPRRVLRQLPPDCPVRMGMPAATRLYDAVAAQGTTLPENADCPITVSEGRQFLRQHLRQTVPCAPVAASKPSVAPPALEWHHVFVRYGRTQPDVLSDFSLTVRTGEWLCLLGGNGAGKTTALAAAAGICPFYAGSVRVFGTPLTRKRSSVCRAELAMVPQDVETLFIKQTVQEELDEVAFDAAQFPWDLTGLQTQHPYDLSGGEQQLVALAKVTAAHPRLLLLDEPTKGLDAQAKQQLMAGLRQLQATGMTIVCITHDMEFAAATADRCAMLFRGQVLAVEPPKQFFASQAFYTTAAHRMGRLDVPDAVTVAELAAHCKAAVSQEDASCG